MTRNDTQRTVRDMPKDHGRDEVRYTRTNPPESEEVAQAKLVQMSDDIAHIEADLEHKEVESFPDESAYELWRKRAISALGYKKAEFRFLESWIRSRQAEQQKAAADLEKEQQRLGHEERRQLHAAFVEIEPQLVKRVKDLTSAIHERYRRMYGVTNPPESQTKAEEREVFLRAIKDRIEAEFADIKLICGRHAIGKKRMKALWLPLSQLAQKVNVEETYLFNFLNPSHLPGSPEGVRAASRHAVLELVQNLLDRVGGEQLFLLVEHIPKDLPEAEACLEVLNAKHSEIQAALHEAGRACAEHGFVGQVLMNLKAPLIEALNLIEEAQQRLGSQIRELRLKQEHDAEETRRNTEMAAEQAHKERLDGLAEIARSVRARSASLAAEIAREYSPVFTAENPPKDLESATRRQDTIAIGRRKVQSALAEVTDAWTSHPLRRGDLPGVKRPLVDILYAMENEARVVKEVVAKFGGDTRSTLDRWKHVCLGALTRAVLEGFKLTSEEQEVLKYLLAEVTRIPPGQK